MNFACSGTVPSLGLGTRYRALLRKSLYRSCRKNGKPPFNAIVTASKTH